MGVVIKVSLNKKSKDIAQWKCFCHPPMKNPVLTSKTYTKLHSTLAERVVYERLPPRRQKVKSDTSGCPITSTSI